jgi:hypothetical protein
MTSAINAPIENEDYNNLVGYSNLVPALSSAAATNKAGSLWGVGYGDRGYGQFFPELSLLADSSVIQVTPWNTLRTILSIIGDHQGLAISNLPPVVSPNNLIEYQQMFQMLLSSMDVGRLTSISGGKTLFPNQAVSTRAAQWGTPATQAIAATFMISFDDENKARYFFNTGGTINFNLQHADVSTPQNQSWNQILNALGTIQFSANNTNRTGTGGTANAIGYYDLTAGWQTIFNGTNIGGGAYSSNDVIIQAQYESYSGLYGAKGAEIRFRVTLTDEHANPFSDVVNGGTTCRIGVTKATTFVAGIQTPTCTNTVNF